MDFIWESITEWLKEVLVGGIMDHLSGMFDAVNQQVGDVATQVGTSPANFSPGVFSMIRNVSESVIIPIGRHYPYDYRLLRTDPDDYRSQQPCQF